MACHGGRHGFASGRMVPRTVNSAPSDIILQGRIQYLGILHLLDRSCGSCLSHLFSRHEQVFVRYLRISMASVEPCSNGLVSRTTYTKVDI
jgi:hypothetical protein